MNYDLDSFAQVSEKPKHLMFATGHKGERGLKRVKIIETMKALAGDKCLTWTKEEFTAEFGKWGKSTIRSKGKMLGYHARVVFDSDKVHAWVIGKIK